MALVSVRGMDLQLLSRPAEELELADIKDCDRVQHRYPLAAEPG